MAHFIEVPIQALAADTLQALLEEFASRDGTDYGDREVSLSQKVGALERQLRRGDVLILYEADCERWDLLPKAQAVALLDD